MRFAQLWRGLRVARPPLPPEFSRPGHGEFEDVAEHYDRLMSTVPYRRWVDYVEALLRRHQRQPRRVLDLACGTGRVGAELIGRGYEAVGLDLSEPMVRYCSSQYPPLPSAVMDARSLALAPESVDLVVSLYDSLNYILEPEGLLGCFQGTYVGLADNGILIFDLNTELALRAGLFTQNNLRSREPLKYSWKSYWYPDRRLCRIDMWFCWEGPGGPKEFEEVHYERAYPNAQVEQMLATAGFSEFSTYNGYTFDRPTSESDRVFYVALT